MNYSATLRAEITRRNQTQEGLNSVARLAGLSADQIRSEIVGVASRQLAEYPQYVGYWDGPEWALVRFSRNVSTKMGRAFTHGDWAIARRDDDGWMAYSVRNRCNTYVPAHTVSVV
jgi:hypothetical protein